MNGNFEGIQVVRIIRTRGRASVILRCGGCNAALELRINRKPCPCQQTPPKKKDRDRLIVFRDITHTVSEWEERFCLPRGSLLPKVMEWGAQTALEVSYLNFRRRYESGLIKGDEPIKHIR